MPQFMIQYRHAGGEWGTPIWAEDIEDAQAKLRSMAGNGKVIGPVYSAPVPRFLPVWFVAPILSLACVFLDAASWVKRKLTGDR